jgi:hypothetical protein
MEQSSSGGGLMLGLFTIFLLGLAVVFGSGAVKNIGVPSSANLLQPATGSSIVGGPSLSAAKVDTILSNAGSPASGTGQTFYNDSQQYGIDDAVALAFFHHESTYGLYGAANQTHSIGNIVCTAGYSCIGRFRAYGTWSQGIDDWYQLIKNVYVDSWHCSTVEAVIPHYAPNSYQSAF